MALTYHRGDELPQWVATVTVNGSTPDLSSGYTFTVTVKQGSDAAVLTKTTNITGATAGVVTVAWADGDLDIAAGTYRVLLAATRTSDSAEWTVEDQLRIVGV